VKNGYLTVLLTCIAVPTIACTGQLQSQAGQRNSMGIDGFIDAVARTNLRDQAQLEALLRQPMRLTDENRFYRFYKLDALQIDASMRATDVELREPRPGTGASSALLTMAVAGDCLQIDDLNARFPGLALFEVPRGRSPDELVSYEVRVSETSVRLGFNQESPSCLTNVTFEQS
jgi:hypothetical protein